MTFWSTLLAIGIQSEPKDQLAKYTILHFSIKSFSPANLLNTLLKILLLLLMLFSLISSLNSRQLSVIHQNFLTQEIYYKLSNENFIPVLSQYLHIYVSQFLSCCSQNRIPTLENQLTGFFLYCTNIEKLGGI